MSKRLHVRVDDDDLMRFRVEAARQGLTLSEWVRRALRSTRAQGQRASVGAKLDAVRSASLHRFPTPEIETIRPDIERGDGATAGADRR